MAGWLDQILSASSTVIGAAIALGGGWLAQSRQDQREREARQDERRKVAIARREDFELQHLVEVHGLLRALKDALVRLSHQTRRWSAEADGYEPVPEEAWNEVNAARDALWAQSGFILADDVRQRVTDAYGHIEHVARGMGENKLWDQLALERVTGAAFEGIAARVREIYASREAG
jgi:hypothetical protein